MTEPASTSSESRRHQMFPILSARDIDRMRGFGEIRRFSKGDTLFRAGEPGPGLFVVLSGTVSIVQRDGLGHVVPIERQGPGQFLAEIAQLSGRPALVDGVAEEDVECLLLAP